MASKNTDPPSEWRTESGELPIRHGTADADILLALLDGRDRGEPWGIATRGWLADRIGVSPQYVGNRFEVLHAGGYLQRPHKGVYRISDKGIEYTETVLMD